MALGGCQWCAQFESHDQLHILAFQDQEKYIVIFGRLRSRYIAKYIRKLTPGEILVIDEQQNGGTKSI